jgi:L,D-peptidoglycan transpeptidase YkuD (ErfK/YbiS/YcfS/YnhG family)
MDWQVDVSGLSGRVSGPDGPVGPCVIGRGGLVSAEAKREGDGATPIGAWPIRYGFYRPDRLAPPATRLDLYALTPADLWCDAPDHPAYNQWVRAPFDAGHERLWRDDRLYDLILVLGYNDAPPVPHAGSAIFAHVRHPAGEPTAGCVALRPEDLRALVERAAPGDRLRVRPAAA